MAHNKNMSGTQDPLSRARRNLSFAKTNKRKAIAKHEADLIARDAHIADLEKVVRELEND